MTGNILLWGAKSQARIVAALLERSHRPVGVIFDHSLDAPTFPTRAKFLNRHEDLRRTLPDCSAFVVCIGGAYGAQRAALSARLRDGWGLRPLSVISPQAMVDPEVELGEGIQVMAGACIGIASRIGEFSLINTNSTVDHECNLGRGVHIMGSAAIAGRVTIEDYASIGTNATVLPGIKIGSGAQIGAGALIRRDVSENSVIVGVPGRVLRVELPNVDTHLLD